ncbi:MAG: hypothetical protein RIE08_05180 [Acidimicrobiales bacterium]
MASTGPDPRDGPDDGSGQDRGTGRISFADLYDEATLRALDAAVEGRPVVEPPRGVAGMPALALATALVSGVREAFEPAESEPVVEHADDPGDALEPVTVLFVPGDPDATVAIVRPWLLAAAGV